VAFTYLSYYLNSLFMVHKTPTTLPINKTNRSQLGEGKEEGGGRGYFGVSVVLLSKKNMREEEEEEEEEDHEQERGRNQRFMRFSYKLRGTLRRLWFCILFSLFDWVNPKVAEITYYHCVLGL
jgi:hypothetical protein